MFSKLATVFALVAYAHAAEVVSEGEVAEQDNSSWSESYLIKSIETVKESNTSMVVAPQQCTKGCPCCSPKIDIKASVLESYKRHRAQVAMIGDYGSCKVGYEGYSWSVDWGDDEGSVKSVASMSPYQAVHTYAKKGKYQVEVTLCANKKGCSTGCTSATKLVGVKP
eukprot:m.18902 g.18902  ORF g.18902 m.18902 type:complete len:167 (+) comp9776_c0_seq1:98-598(+)